jgi:hypothetical protein
MEMATLWELAKLSCEKEQL